MPGKEPVVIIGAGISGLAAAAEIGRAGLPVVVLEARERIGGRIFTQREPAYGAPIELGAEFIHGVPSEIWEPLRKSGANITEVNGDNWCVFRERLSPCDFFSEVDQILDGMDDSLPDQSFLAYLERGFPDQAHTPGLGEAKRHAIGYVSGFNAADPALVGVHWLVAGMRAEEKNEGHRAFRSGNGYSDLLEFFQRQLEKSKVKVETGSVVERVTWKRGLVEVLASRRNAPAAITCRHVLITLPVSLLKSANGPGAVNFVPSLPEEKIAALDKIEMGKVIRIVLRFRRRFWDTISPAAGTASGSERKTLSNMSFLFSEDELFPTWWTKMPSRDPLITGWAPFRSAERLSGLNPSAITKHALETLSQLLRTKKQDLENQMEGSYVHDWRTDPFSLGAYSYGRVGGDGAQQILASPVENTLFFAGEATDTSGNNGTVHGAIASGHRAAAEIIEASRR